MAKFRIVSITPTSEGETEPVTVTELKAYLQLTGTGYDGPLGTMITAARKQIENYTNVSLVEKTLRFVVRNTGTDKPFPLPFPPIVDVESLTFKRCRSTSVIQTYETDWWFIDPDATYKQIICNNSTFGSDQFLTVVYTTEPPTLIAPWKQAILSQAGYMYNNRDADRDLIMAPECKNLIDSMRNNYF